MAELVNQFTVVLRVTLSDGIVSKTASGVTCERCGFEFAAQDVTDNLVDQATFHTLSCPGMRVQLEAARVQTPLRKCWTCLDDPRGQLIDCDGSAGYMRCDACGQPGPPPVVYSSYPSGGAERYAVATPREPETYCMECGSTSHSYCARD